jgi:hypothetical protein
MKEEDKGPLIFTLICQSEGVGNCQKYVIYQDVCAFSPSPFSFLSYWILPPISNCLLASVSMSPVASHANAGQKLNYTCFSII